MDAFLQQFQDLKIQLEEITSATDNFNDDNNYIGGGGFGRVYKGQLVSHFKGRSMVAIKRLDPKYGQGTPEFLKEITMLSRYKHENLISLLGFCNEGCEMILVYELASRGSLDHYLNSPYLTWTRRMKICVDAAKGLSYLHDPRETHQRLIHCDMKSANILLDDKWSAKVSDFGLSIMGPANEQHSVVVTNPVGTYGYCDPQYVMTHTLTKESDVYSFGVVLFEVLCGTLCCTYRANGVVEKNFVPMWIESYKQNKLDDIIFKDPTIQPIDQCALETFSDIAYRCLTESREDRPKMAEVVTELETAYEIQELSEWMHPFDYEEMTKTAYPRLNYKSKGELGRLLLKGVLLNDGNTWFSLNKNREHCVMISFAECLDSAPSEFTSKKSRFVVGPYQYENGRVKTHVKTQFLTPLITYAVNLVFKFRRIVNKTGCPELVRLKYKLQGETESSIAYLADERKDGWWMCELYQFTSQDHRTIDLEIIFDGFHGYHYFGNAIEVEGIEFRPLEKVEHKDEDQPISDSDANWEEKLPVDYEDMLKWSKNSMQWTTKKEAYSIMRKGFLINDGQEWLSLDKNGKKCYMLSARVAGSSGVSRSVESVMLPVPESRFGEAIECHSWELSIDGYIKLQLVSSQTTYASYLIYKLPKDQSEFEAPILVKYKVYDSCYIYLVNPQTPIIRPNADQNTHNPLNMPKIKGVPQQRNDGWMEVQIWEFRSARTAETILLHLYLKSCATKKFKGLIVEGVEFRPTDTNKL